MANNVLTPEQDLLTREFYVKVADKAEELLPDSKASCRALRGVLLMLLNYDQLPNGAFITKGTTVQLPFGSKDYGEYEDEWQGDYDRAVEAIAMEALDEASDDQDTSETSTSEQAEDSALRKTVLSKDV